MIISPPQTPKIRRTLTIDKHSDKHKRLVKMLTARIDLAKKSVVNRDDTWRRAEETVMAYVDEQDIDRARDNNRDNGQPTYSTIQIPYTYAMLMSAHTYLTSVFFARSPIHQFSGRHGEGEQQVQCVEALIDYQVNVGEMVGPYYIWLYDACKYGMGVIGQYWDKEILHYGALVEMDGQLFQATQEIEGYEGNRSYNVSPYDFLPDPRVAVRNFQQGEFVAIRKRLSWAEVVKRDRAGWIMNVDCIKDHVSTPPTEGSSHLERPETTEWMTEGLDPEDKHPARVTVYEVYVELIPSEWGVGDTNYPQKWVFTITYDLGLIIGASPLSYVHGRFPFDVIEMEVEGYGRFARGMPEILEPLQNTIDWLVNSHFYNVRASLNNQFIMDPSKIVISDAEDEGPGFIYRLRPEAYGTDLKTCFLQVPVQDVTRTNFTDIQQVMSMAERVTGVNDQIMGALSAGGRKTATEVRASTGFGVNRLKTVSEYMSASGFASHAQKLLQTSQQNYQVDKKLRIVGDLATQLDPASKFINVTPQDIKGFFDLVPVDGTMPVDRMAQANLWKEIFASLRNMPATIATGYDWVKMFGWMATLGGLKNINQFKIQVLPPGMAPSPGATPMTLPQPSAPSPTGASSGNASTNNFGAPQTLPPARLN